MRLKAASPRRRGRPRRPGATVALLLAALALGACQQSPPPNVVLVTVDTLRADRLNPYGYDEIATPAIAALAAQGIVFERAFADTSWTLPSLSSVMTGTYPSEHRVRSWSDTLGDEQQTLAELLKARGYTTAAIVGSYPLDRYFGFAQGFDHYDDAMTQPLFADAAPDAGPAPERPSDDSDNARNQWRLMREKSNAFRTDREVADAAIAWLAGNQASPLFLWVHFFGPHEKGKRVETDPARQKALAQEQIARYDDDVVEMDRQVGRFLDALRADPRYADTALIFHSDHGQSLHEHGLFGHGFDLYDTTVHVPLIVRLPGDRDAGSRVSHLVRNLDIFATILALAGADTPGERASRNLLAAAPAEDNHAYLETHPTLAFSARDVTVGDRTRKVGQVLRGVRTDAFKLVSREPFLAEDEDRSQPLPEDYVERQTSVSLYDFAADPNETKNAAAARPRHAARLKKLLGGYDAGRGAEARGGELSEAQRERLRSLGYDP